MAVPYTGRLDTRLVLREGDRLLLARPPGDAWHVLPGGPVEPDESVDHALTRHVGPLDNSGGSREFVGAVEHREVAGPGTGTSDRDGLDAATLTVLFAADRDEDLALPGEWQGHSLHLVDVDVLLGTRLRPLPVAWAVRRWVQEGWPVWLGAATAAQARWARLRPSVASLRAQLAARRHELRGAEFRDASVAMCALVTAADGRIDPAEREALRAFVATDPVMSGFPAAEVERLFDEHLQRLQSDVEAGKATALTEIGKVRGRAAEARAVIRIGEVIGRSDGQFAPAERAVVREAIAVLGLDPFEFSAQEA